MSTIMIDSSSLPSPKGGNLAKNNDKKHAAPMPLINRFQHSMEPDKWFGWKPKNKTLFTNETKRTKKKGEYSKIY